MKQLAFLALVLASASGLGFADSNLLPNGDFSNAEQIVGWSVPLSPPPLNSLFWNSEDANGNPNSGSMELNLNTSGYGTIALSRCFGVRPNAGYSYGGQSRVMAEGGGLTFSCTSYTDPLCTAGASYLTPYSTMLNGANWQQATGTSGTLPGNAEYVSCTVTFTNSNVSSAASALVDNLYFDSASADHIFSNDFELPAGF